MFNLEKAIGAWKKDLAKKRSLEDTYLAELEAVLRDEVADLIASGAVEEEAFLRASAEMGESREIDREFAKVRSSRSLLGNYLRVALRKIRRQKGYAAVNIAGLGVGLACCILMLLWVADERSFDRFHVQGDSIYRMITERATENGVLLDARAATPLGPALRAALPEVEDFCRYRTFNTYVIWDGNKPVSGDIIGTADPSFFTLFTFPFIAGDARTALVNPASIVITESLARKYFGDGDPLGKILILNHAHDPFTVTGVIRDVPENSHLRFDGLIPIANMSRYHHINFENWNSMFFYLYVRLSPAAGPAALGTKAAGRFAANISGARASYRLQPLADVHLKSDFVFDLDNDRQGSASTLSVFSIAAAVVLLLACINFMNLATARSVRRAREVGLRKVTGARRSDLIRQFLGESVVLSFLGLALAVILLSLAFPLFNHLAGKHLTLGGLFGTGILAGILGITVFTGLLAGAYPALFLSALPPVMVFKDKGPAGGKGRAGLRKSLVVVQFALTAFLVIGTVIVNKQLAYVRNKNLGLDPHDVLTMEGRLRDFREAVSAHPAILSLSLATPPGSQVRDNTSVSWDGKNPETVVPFLPLSVDEEYLKTFRIRMAEGRFFEKNRPADRTSSVIVNETAARFMGPGSPLGKRVTYQAMDNEGVFREHALTVIGIMKDFHQSSLRRTIEPMLFVNDGQSLSLNIRIHKANMAETIAFLEKTWKANIPVFPFTYRFLDDRLDGFYASERKLRSILGVFTLLALFTACLGLFGLASFIAEQRTKEIGIRKVLGASSRSLVFGLSREFAVWVLLANIVAWPAAYFVVGRWLQEFAYRVRPGFWPAVIAAAFSLFVALLAVGAKAVGAARTSPAEAIRME